MTREKRGNEGSGKTTESKGQLLEDEGIHFIKLLALDLRRMDKFLSLVRPPMS